MIWSWSLDLWAISALGVDERLTKRPGVHTMNPTTSQAIGTKLEVFHHLLDPHFLWHFGCGFETFHVPGLVICYSSRTGNWPIEIVDLPNLKKVIFQFAILVYQRVWVNLFWAPTTFRCWSFWCRLHPDKGGDKQQFQQLQVHMACLVATGTMEWMIMTFPFLVGNFRKSQLTHIFQRGWAAQPPSSGEFMGISWDSDGFLNSHGIPSRHHRCFNTTDVMVQGLGYRKPPATAQISGML